MAPAMPNRKDEVEAIVARYPQAFGKPDNTLDARRRLLAPIIVRELNKLDADQWFLVNRLDRNDDDPKPGRLTSDVIAWGPTKEHVDVLSSKGAMWNEHPPITDDDWKLEHWSNWPSWDDASPAPTPTPYPPPPPMPPPPPAPGDDTRLRALEQQVAAQGAVIESLRQRVQAIEDAPAPTFELPELVAEGNTSREWGHGHAVRLPVRKA